MGELIYNGTQKNEPNYKWDSIEQT